MAEPTKPLELKPGLLRTLAYSDSLRTDLCLLECNEDLLERVLSSG